MVMNVNTICMLLSDNGIGIRYNYLYYEAYIQVK